MNTCFERSWGFRWGVVLGLLLAACVRGAWAQDAAKPPATETKPSMTIYGFAMVDFGMNFTQIDSSWYDTMKVSKLPSYDRQYGEDGSTFAGVRQTRFGVRAATPAGPNDLNVKFEIDMFGTGADAGQTTIRLRHAWGEWGAFGAGQTDSPFEDGDVWPNSLEYWGPSGMVFFRNVQVRWTPVKGDHTLMIALERPGASGDAGVLADRIELQNIKGRTPLPDLTGAYRYGADWGYVRVGGALRKINWDDMLDDQYDLSGSTTGWGLNFSSNLKPTASDVIRLQFMFGEGVENYMQDSPVDIGIERNSGSTTAPIKGVPIPVIGLTAFLDHTWGARWSTAVGYSMVDHDNTEGQNPDAYNKGHYALFNLLFTPAANIMVGGEFQWGRRENFSDGFKSDGVKVQFSFKYNFSHTLGGR
jgi:hypothetical protein